MKPVLGRELVRTLNDKHGYFRFADAQGDVSVAFANEAVELFLGLSVEAAESYEETGKTPSELARSLADAQAEIARLRGALESIRSITTDNCAWSIASRALGEEI